jgi:hypothetical protein
MTNKTAHTILLMWDCNGLEYCEDITKRDQAHFWSELSGRESLKQFPNLNHLVLRARYNPQRHYEIYAIDVEPDVTVEQLTEMFNATPQAMVDLIRERGRQLYSDRATNSVIV